MSELVLKANAKINLFLEVGARRPDGYHDIFSVMQSVTLADTVSVRAGEGTSPGIRLECSSLPADKRNIAYRAAEIFYTETGLEPRVDITIEKHIPVAAGLAGGSTDGAATLYALDSLYGYPLNSERLSACAARLGADVPFCLFGGTMLAGGIGERLVPCAPMPDCSVLIAKRSEGVLTPQAFGALDRSREDADFTLRKSENMLSALEEGSLHRVGGELYNAFASLPYAEALGTHRITRICRDCGGYALLSGSGPSVFALFEREEDSGAAAMALKDEFDDISVFLCRPAKTNYNV